MVQRILVGLVLCLALGLGFSVWKAQGYAHRLELAQNRVTQLEVAVAAQERSNAELARRVQETEKARQKAAPAVTEALKKEKEYAESIVPDSIADALRM